MPYFRYDIILETTEYEKQQQQVALEREEEEQKLDARERTVRLVSVEESEAFVSISKEEVMRNILTEKQNNNLVFGERWCSVDGGKRKLVSFWVVPSHSDMMDAEVRSLGFGAKGSNTVVHVNKEEISEGFPCPEMAGETAPLDKGMLDMLKITTGSLTVRSVLDNIKQKSQITFECLVQLISATNLSGFGLALNQSLLIVASMFLAPFMEALNLLTFACRVKEKRVILNAMRTLLLYSVAVIGFGFLNGACMFGYVYVSNQYAKDEKDYRYLPSEEMYSRTTIEGVVLGVIVSAISAMSSYISIVKPRSDNVHVGNAISLSLVPPLTNAGMYLAMCCFSAYLKNTAIGSCREVVDMCYNSTLINSTAFRDSLSACKDESMGLRTLLGGKTNYKEAYICHMERDLAWRMFMSICVTLVNVLMLQIVGMVLLWLARFRIKQLSLNHVHTFFKYDIDYYNQTKTIKNRDPNSTSEFISNIRQQLEERTHLPRTDVDIILETAQKSVHYQSIVGGNRQEMLDNMFSELLDDERSSEHNTLDVPLSNGIGISNEGVRLRPRSRVLSDNQRTLRDTMLSHDFDPNPHERHAPVRFYSQPDENVPLSLEEESVGRFQVSASKSGEKHDDSEAVGRFHVAPASP